MKRKRFTEEQIAFAPRQAELGAAVAEITRKLGVSEQTFYRWKRKFAGHGASQSSQDVVCGTLPRGKNRGKHQKSVTNQRGASERGSEFVDDGQCCLWYTVRGSFLAWAKWIGVSQPMIPARPPPYS